MAFAFSPASVDAAAKRRDVGSTSDALVSSAGRHVGSSRRVVGPIEPDVAPRTFLSKAHARPRQERLPRADARFAFPLLTRETQPIGRWVRDSCTTAIARAPPERSASMSVLHRSMSASIHDASCRVSSVPAHSRMLGADRIHAGSPALAEASRDAWAFSSLALAMPRTSDTPVADASRAPAFGRRARKTWAEARPFAASREGALRRATAECLPFVSIEEFPHGSPALEGEGARDGIDAHQRFATRHDTRTRVASARTSCSGRETSA